MEKTVPNAARRYTPESAHVARTFLADLRQSHRDLLAQIQRLEAMSYEAEPDRTALTISQGPPSADRSIQYPYSPSGSLAADHESLTCPLGSSNTRKPAPVAGHEGGVVSPDSGA